MSIIGVLHPGAMGSVLGAGLVAAGHDVRWTSNGRSDATAERAAQAGLVDLVSLEALADGCDGLLSICPPAAAEEVATRVAATGYGGLYVDANAIAPSTSRRIGTIVERSGARFVDGGIVGGPPTEPGTTRLYLSGGPSSSVASWFTDTHLGTVVVDGPPGAASAVKAAFAGWTKGSAALLLAVRAFARAEGVEDVLLDEWSISLPDVRQRSEDVAARIHRKAWRFAGELEEIGDALGAAGLPAGFHHAAAEVYGRLADLKEQAGDQDPADVHDRLIGHDPA